MSHRSESVYVTRETKRRLRWIVEAMAVPTLTIDELADRWLNEVAEAKHPGILELESDYKELCRTRAEKLKLL